MSKPKVIPVKLYIVIVILIAIGGFFGGIGLWTWYDNDELEQNEYIHSSTTLGG